VSARPVLFNGAMVRAILAGAKTQTRRLVKPQPQEGADPRWTWCVSSTNRSDVGAFHCGVIAPDGNSFTDRGRERQTAYRCPLGAPGDDLWVRESAYIAPPHFGDRNATDLIDDKGRPRVVGYAASTDADAVRCAHYYGVKLTPSIHMPRWASRLTLRVTSVRVERLHAITEDDARCEGIRGYTRGGTPRYAPGGRGGSEWPWEECQPTAREAFAKLWRGINGAESWEANPWVWVVSFERGGAK